ncbi:MAG: DUF3876 domain-containing protein [Prevotella sp.]|jgi:hypothetical protein|nr:DUF3876 domain-containing protein [Prevotella sp.]
MKTEEYQDLNRLSSWQGGWESVNGNPDVYIFRGYDGNYYLLAYSYDKDYGRGCFSCYEIDSDETGCYVRMGMKYCRLVSEESPQTLYIEGWGGYMKN